MNQAAGSGENTRLIVLISVVATIGGFLFGFDSGVINGTQDGLHRAFRSGEVDAGLRDRVDAAGLCGGRVQCWPAGRPPGPSQRVDPVGSDVPAVGTRCRGGGLLGLVHCGAGGGWIRGRRSQRDLAGLHCRVAPARYRGRLATVQQIAIITGLTAAFLSNYLLAAAAGASTEPLWGGQAAWRWMFWMQAASLVFLLLLLTIPEPARYLVVKRRKEDALRVLTRLLGSDKARATLEEIDASLSNDHHRPSI